MAMSFPRYKTIADQKSGVFIDFKYMDAKPPSESFDIAGLHYAALEEFY